MMTVLEVPESGDFGSGGGTEIWMLNRFVALHHTDLGTQA